MISIQVISQATRIWETSQTTCKSNNNYASMMDGKFIFIIRLEDDLNGKVGERTVAKSMLVLMVRGLCTSLQYPYAQFACNALKGHQMYSNVLVAIMRLEKLD